MRVLRLFAVNLGLDYTRLRKKADLVDSLEKAFDDGKALASTFRHLDEAHKLTLRLALDGGKRGLMANFLSDELGHLGIRQPKKTIMDLVRSGLLIPMIENRTYSNSLDSVLLESSLDYYPLFVPDSLAPLLCSVEIPGEQESWGGTARRALRAEPVRSVSPEEVIESLKATCSVVDRYPQPLKRSGLAKVVVMRHLEKIGFQGVEKFGFHGWLVLARALGLVEIDRDTSSWSRAPFSSMLTMDPLGVFGALPQALCKPTASYGEGFVIESRGDFRGVGSRYLSRSSMGLWVKLQAALIEELQTAAGSFLADGQWFYDSDLNPIASAIVRKEFIRKEAQSGFLEHYRLSFVREHARKQTSALFAGLCELGLTEKGMDGKKPASRLTPLGAAVLATGDNPLSTIRGQASWSNDGSLIANRPHQVELLALALGPLWDSPADGSRPEGDLRISAGSIKAALRAGMSAEAIERRLALLTGGEKLPAGLSMEIDRLGNALRPTLLADRIAALEVTGLDRRERATLHSRGFFLRGDLILLPESQVEALTRDLDLSVSQKHDYRRPPDRRCRLGENLTLSISESAMSDLRLSTRLETFGISPPLTDSLKLDFENMPGTERLSPEALDRHLSGALLALEPHLADGVPAGAWLRLRAGAGLVCAPQVEDYLVLTFPKRIARGLADAGVLGEDVEILEGGRFLIPRAALGKIEHKLSELDIPFPADKSSLCDTLAARAAVKKLHQALAEPEKDRPTATGIRRIAGRQKTRVSGRDRAKIEKRVLETLQDAWADGGRGMRVGELCQATGEDRKVLGPLLRRLVRREIVTLSGYTRGARYNLAPAGKQ
jgi:hypothetical protein